MLQASSQANRWPYTPLGEVLAPRCNTELALLAKN